MKMKVFYTDEVAKLIEKLDHPDHTRVQRTREFFENHGFQIGPKYIKKIRSGIWELRAGKFRLFLCIIGDTAIGVHFIHKKSQKLLQRDIRLAEKRCREI